LPAPILAQKIATRPVKCLELSSRKSGNRKVGNWSALARHAPLTRKASNSLEPHDAHPLPGNSTNSSSAAEVPQGAIVYRK